VAHFFIPLYMLVTVAWPWRGERFLYGVLPFLYAYLLIGGLAIMRVASMRFKYPERVSKTWVSRLVVGAFVILLCAKFGRGTLIDGTRAHLGDLSAGAAWIQENAPSGAVVAAEQPWIAYLYTQRASVELPSNVPALRCLAARWDGVYLLIRP
jgi:hypothetical protein